MREESDDLRQRVESNLRDMVFQGHAPTREELFALHGLPRNTTELYNKNKKLVSNLIRRYDKVRRNHNDIVQTVWMNLLNADILKKFEDSAWARLPNTLTALEVCTVLGISWPQFKGAQWEREIGRVRVRQGKRVRVKKTRFAPPVQGTWSSHSALYSMQSVMAALAGMEATRGENGDMMKTRGAFRLSVRTEESNLPIPPEAFSTKRFEAYLAMAVHNYFKNWCRTVTRRDRDIYLPPTRRSDSSAEHPWEHDIVDPSHAFTDDDIATIHQIRKADKLTGGLASIVARNVLDGLTVQDALSKALDESRASKNLKRLYSRRLQECFSLLG